MHKRLGLAVALATALARTALAQATPPDAPAIPPDAPAAPPAPPAPPALDPAAVAKLVDAELDARLDARPPNAGWKDGFYVQSDDGASFIRVGGFLQYDYRDFVDDGANPLVD